MDNFTDRELVDKFKVNYREFKFKDRPDEVFGLHLTPQTDPRIRKGYWSCIIDQDSERVARHQLLVAQAIREVHEENSQIELANSAGGL